MMTKEEAIRVLELYNPFLGGDDKKLLSEAMDVAIKALHQFADPGKKVSAEGQENDPVSRKAAIDAVKRLSLGETDATRLAMRIVDYLERLPSAQPEIIRCGQLKYAEVADSEDSQDGYTCQFHRGSIWFSGSYCSWAERRQDEL